MAQYGRLRVVVRGTTGIPVSGASVEVRKQGATVNGLHAGATTSFTVNDPGALAAADNVQVGTDSGTTRSVSSVTATNVTVGGGGFTDVADDSRLTCIDNLPTLYNDAQGAESKSNPLTTDSSGVAECWASVRPYDLLVSGSGVTTQLLQDEVPVGNERFVSNVYPGAGPAYIFDTARVLTTDDKIISVRENNVEKASIDDDGDIAGAKGTFSGAVAGTTGTFSGALTVTSGGADITGTATLDAVVMSGALSGATSLSTTGDVIQRRIRPNQGTAHVAGDWALSAGWGTTATASVASGCNDTCGLLSISSSGTGQAANPTVTLTAKDGAFGGGIRGVAVRADTASPAPETAVWCSTSASGTQIVWTFRGTPVAGSTYTLMYWHFTAA